jgi:CxxC motif-containing protein (DUF1111 family)
MKTSKALAFCSPLVFLSACSTGPTVTHLGQSPNTKPAPQILGAPVGFDDATNGVVDNQTHQADKARFDQFESVSDGLGPLFNGQSCRECHQSPVSGGVSQVTELRVGHKGPQGQFQTPEIPINRGAEVIKGRTLVNQRAICPNAAFPRVEIQERVPDAETIRTLRRAVGLLGDGYVEAVDDATLSAISDKQCKQSHGKICGLALRVPVLESPGETRIGRFGWKSQQASLLSFSGDAYLNEVGITNRLFPDEVTNLCNTVAEPNDRPGPDGLSDLDHFARFIRATKAPTRDIDRAGTPAARAGETLFATIGCSGCHVATLTTAPPGTLINGGKFAVPEALGNKTFHPYSDYLLHDVGTGDGIAVAMEEHYGKQVYKAQWQAFSPKDVAASADRVRTAPLWGVRLHTTLMHDGASLTFRDAILRHRGEATDATKRFDKLSQVDQDSIIEFLRSL